MKTVVKTFSVTVGGKINLGNYNSLQIDQTRWVDIVLEEGEDITLDQVEMLVDEQKNSIRRQLRAWAKEKDGEKKPVVQEKEFFAGKPVEYDSNAQDWMEYQGGIDPRDGRGSGGEYEESGIDPRDGMPFGDK